VAVLTTEGSKKMQRIFTTVSLILIISVLVILVLAARQKKSIAVVRSVEIRAQPDRIFALINDFHHWPDWAPQDTSDATMIRTYAGAASGQGAVSEWTSKGQAGAGRMEIVESIPAERVTVRVDFARPFQLTNTNQFILESTGERTRVTWSMHGPSPFLARVVGLFINMDRVMGKHFELGLQSLKMSAEG
jgi:uncharacterized protein YndB with AHSA1/START domain